jgi:sensor c-di-GMP phosphodiesterase-like protein
MNLQDIIQQIKDAVNSALYKCGLPSMGEMHAKLIIITFVAAVVGIVALVLVLRILKKRKLKKSIIINLDDSEAPLAQKTRKKMQKHLVCLTRVGCFACNSAG